MAPLPGVVAFTVFLQCGSSVIRERRIPGWTAPHQAQGGRWKLAPCSLTWQVGSFPASLAAKYGYGTELWPLNAGASDALAFRPGPLTFHTRSPSPAKMGVSLLSLAPHQEH